MPTLQKKIIFNLFIIAVPIISKATKMGISRQRAHGRTRAASCWMRTCRIVSNPWIRNSSGNPHPAACRSPLPIVAHVCPRALRLKIPIFVALLDCSLTCETKCVSCSYPRRHPQSSSTWPIQI